MIVNVVVVPVVVFLLPVLLYEGLGQIHFAEDGLIAALCLLELVAQCL
jgi:hypothetical protein